MPALQFPRTHVGLLAQLGARLLDSRKPKTDHSAFARELLVGAYDVFMRSGLDRVLVELGEASPPLDIGDRTALADHPGFLAALAAKLPTLELDGGGPRNIRPGQLADAVLSALGLTVVDEADRTITLDGKVRAEVMAALASSIEPETAVPQMRETIIETARARCEPRYQAAFDKLAAQLDERGQRIVKQLRLPLDAVHAVERTLTEARDAFFDRVVRSAVDRAKDVLARAHADAAARIDQPVTYALTPREVAVLRAADPHVPKTPERVVESVLESLTELCHLAWRTERPVRVYAASQTFAVGDLIEHPKFGRGSVVTSLPQRIEVEFADGKHTLVHVGLRR
jgi:hypothetical protein